ncbi:threonine/homoserine/homoserine lactone efflux protein [Mycobacterium sp. MAA66]|uniref:GAP family protein n=1 Tax=Mycobacterium sp. MAA66 TaxID=3156297 RepID=UPI0035115CF9
MTNWVSVLTELIPLALVIALSPLSIIPAVLILQTPQARVTGLTFLAGWLLAIAVVTGVFVELGALVPHAAQPSTTASWVRIVIGTLLIIFGVYRWTTRKHATEEPGWMRRLRTVTPASGFVTAAVLAVVNPKVLFMCIAAGLTIDTDQLSAAATWTAVLCFAVVAGSSVAIPVLIYAAAGERLDPTMARLGDWLHRQHAVLVAGILIVIGVLVLLKGLTHL